MRPASPLETAFEQPRVPAPRRRARALGTRLFLIAAGVLIGLAARWMYPPNVHTERPIFVPMPPAESGVDG